MSYWPISDLAEQYPRMSRRQFRMLVEDVAENGIREPILLWNDGSGDAVVDGRHRLAAAAELGITRDDIPKLSLSPALTRAEVAARLFSRNLTTRHLSAGQRAMLAARMGRAGHGGARPGKASDRPDTWEPAPEARASRAALFGVSKSQVRRADFVVDHGAAALAESVFAGTLSLTAAERIARAEMEPPPDETPPEGDGAGEWLELDAVSADGSRAGVVRLPLKPGVDPVKKKWLKVVIRPPAIIAPIAEPARDGQAQNAPEPA